MTLLEHGESLLRLARWGAATLRPDTAFPSPVAGNPLFQSPRDAVRRIADGAVVAASGFGVHQRASILYHALVEEFAARGRPRDLTVVNIGGHGGRGILPGTLDELGRRGLCRRLVTSHFETFHRFLDLAAAGECELQCLPLGVMALLYDAQARGRRSLTSDTGVGTFLDPRVGRGSPLTGGGAPLVAARGERLRYTLPLIDVALFNLPAADRDGNLYALDAAVIGDALELARAARRNGGRVIANVGLLVEPGYGRVFLPADMVDAVVYYPWTEQTLGFFHDGPWRLVSRPGRTAAAGDVAGAVAATRALRRAAGLVGAFPRRTPVDAAVWRLAAATLVQNAPRGARVVLGTGMPEELGAVLFEHGGLRDLTLMIESGAVGGVPAAGGYFGVAFGPREIVSTAEIFRRCERRLDVACLGALEVDGEGNVNVSSRGPELRTYIGPGGFVDFATMARTIVFVCGWARRGAIEVDGQRLRVRRAGEPKFVTRVTEVSFNARHALDAGKRVFYATPVGLFRLTRRGLTLTAAFPGIDVRRDVVGATPVRIQLPASGRVARLPGSIVNGVGFSLARRSRTLAAPRRRRRAS